MANIFESRRVRLRAHDPADDPVYQTWVGQETESNRYLYEIPFPAPRVIQPAAEFKPPAGDNFPFTIETLAGELAGAIHVQHCNPRCGTFMYGISILPDHRRKGYAFEAIMLVLRYYFEERRYQKCTTEVYSFNEASARLHERLGFTLEGRLRRMVFTNGQFHDTLVYGITHDEFVFKEES